MGAQRPVQFIKLFTAGGRNGDRHAQVFPGRAFPQFYGALVKLRVKVFGNLHDGMHQPVDAFTHDLDGEHAGVLDQRFIDHLRATANNGRQALGCAGCLLGCHSFRFRGISDGQLWLVGRRRKAHGKPDLGHLCQSGARPTGTQGELPLLRNLAKLRQQFGPPLP